MSGINVIPGQHGGARAGGGRPKGSKANHDAATRFAEARARKEHALADLREQEVATRARTLIPAPEVEERIATAFATVAASLLGLPDDLERRHGLDADLVESVEVTVHEVLDALAERLVDLAPSVGMEAAS